jgi:23S rRNA (cytosine1962-C5)-methyltransferase
MDRAQPDFLPALHELLAPRAIVLRNDVPVRERESLPQEKRVLHGDIGGPVRVRMNGLAFDADLLEGQKTGVYLDQRDNYLAAARHARPGRALDCFTSTGGFALHLASRCDSVTAIDSSAPAVARARSNAALNSLANIHFHEADVFDFLAAEQHGHQTFSTIVLDPPAFAKSRSTLEGAARGYKEINLRALKLLAPGGVLVTCSCSHHMSEAMFLAVVAEAALDAGKTLRVLERRTQAADHPILLTVPETLYLKCLILEALPA